MTATNTTNWAPAVAHRTGQKIRRFGGTERDVLSRLYQLAARDDPDALAVLAGFERNEALVAEALYDGVRGLWVTMTPAMQEAWLAQAAREEQS